MEHLGNTYATPTTRCNMRWFSPVFPLPVAIHANTGHRNVPAWAIGDRIVNKYLCLFFQFSKRAIILLEYL
jgi:hypothetical protein